MKSIIDFITYEAKFYNDIISWHERQEVEYLAARVSPLKKEILEYPKSNINILSSGVVNLTGFPNELEEKIKLLRERERDWF